MGGVPLTVCCASMHGIRAWHPCMVSLSPAAMAGPDLTCMPQWQAQTLRRDQARERRIRGRMPPGKSLAETYRSPAPYGVEPPKAQTDEAKELLHEMCSKHRVNLQLLFDTYGYRDYSNRCVCACV